MSIMIMMTILLCCPLWGSLLSSIAEKANDFFDVNSYFIGDRENTLRRRSGARFSSWGPWFTQWNQEKILLLILNSNDLDKPELENKYS